MPSPFPGMDPYLEGKDQWPVAHSALIYCCYAALNVALPPQYRARMEERVYVIEPPFPNTSSVSDVAVIRRTPSAGGSVAVLPPLAATPDDEDAPMLLRASRAEVRERYIDVVAVNARGRVVATVEVLSPANKRPGAGREEYQRKQRAMLDSDTHLLEIDLLRQGDHTVAAPASGMLLEHGPWHYAFSLHRGGNGGETFEAWARTVRERLPRLRVPLSDGAPDVGLDLPAILTRVYDEGQFAREIDYTAEPEPPLSPGDAAWADALLREKGLRPA